MVLIGGAIGALMLLCCGLGAVATMLDDGPDDAPQKVAAAPVSTPSSSPAAALTPSSSTAPTTPAPSTGRATAPSTAPAAAPRSAPGPAAPVYYANCDAARAAGAAPIRRGEPGYRPPLDRDNDGVACEESSGDGSSGGGSSGGGSSGGDSTDPRFGTCREAKAAGYGPYRRGQDPEYTWYRDADSDGLVCE